MPRVHIGKLIQEELERQERSASWLARKLYCDRTNVYKIFKRSTIDTDLLLRVSIALGRDFFSEYVKLVEEYEPETTDGQNVQKRFAEDENA